MCPYGHFECGTRFVVLFLLRIENRQVVIRLGQFRVVFSELGEDADRLCRLVHFRVDQALEESTLGILGLVAQIGVDFFKCLRVLTLLDQALNLRQIVGKGRRCEADGQADSDCTQCL